MPKQIVFTSHALQRMKERGVTEEQVREAINIGQRKPAQRDLVQFRLNLEFNDKWAGKFYRIQQVVPIVAEEKDRLIVITVYAFYFQEGEQQ